jgi:ankyrin repeat protein
LRIAVRWGEADVADLLRERGADDAAVSAEDRALGRYLSGGGAAPDVPAAELDALLIAAIDGGHDTTARRLLDAGARVDGDPESDAIPLQGACWRRRVEMVRELVERGAALEFRSGGTAIGAAQHGSRHCHHPEGGPTMATVEEIPQAPYAEILRILGAASAAG